MHLHVSTTSRIAALRSSDRARTPAARPLLVGIAILYSIVLVTAAAEVIVSRGQPPASPALWQAPAPAAPIVGARVLTPALDRAMRFDKARLTPPALPTRPAAVPAGPAATTKPDRDLLDRIIERSLFPLW